MSRSITPTYRDYLQQLAEHPQTTAWDYGMSLHEIDQMKLFARQASTVIFLLDYSSKSYPFMDRSTRQIMGHSHEAYYEGGLEFMLHNFVTFDILNQDIHRDRAEFLKNYPPKDIAKLRFSMSYRYKTSSGERRTILQRHTIMQSTEQNLPVVIFGFAWDITHQTPKGRLIHQIEELNLETGDWSLRLGKEFYPDIDKDKLLSKREIEILKWAVEGYSSKQIASKLSLSMHTVNTHRQNMLRKTNCQNSMELLRYALNYGFL
jgi:DNA-binding CsgD family transcriptional regulator